MIVRYKEKGKPKKVHASWIDIQVTVGKGTLQKEVYIVAATGEKGNRQVIIPHKDLTAIEDESFQAKEIHISERDET